MVIVNKLHHKKVVGMWSVCGRPTTYQPPTNHLTTDHLPTTYRPLTDRLPTTYWPLTDHLPTTYRPHTNHIPTTYRPLFYGAACSQLPYFIITLKSEEVLSQLLKFLVIRVKHWTFTFRALFLSVESLALSDCRDEMFSYKKENILTIKITMKHHRNTTYCSDILWSESLQDLYSKSKKATIRFWAPQHLWHQSLLFLSDQRRCYKLSRIDFCLCKL